MPLVNLLTTAPTKALKLPRWVQYEKALALITTDKVFESEESSASESESGSETGAESEAEYDSDESSGSSAATR